MDDDDDDASSVLLGDAIVHMKHLRDRVKRLEELQAAKQNADTVVVVRRTQLDDESAEEESGSSGEQWLPEVEAKVNDQNILLKIHCRKRKGVLVRTLLELEKLNLAVLNASVAPFGDLFLDITITAKMNNDFNIPAKGISAAVRSALQNAPQ